MCQPLRAQTRPGSHESPMAWGSLRRGTHEGPGDVCRVHTKAALCVVSGGDSSRPGHRTPTPQFFLLHHHCRLGTASPQGCWPWHCAPCTPRAQQHPECKGETPRLGAALLRQRASVIASPVAVPGLPAAAEVPGPPHHLCPSHRHRVRTSKSVRAGGGRPPRTHLEEALLRVRRRDGAGVSPRPGYHRFNSGPEPAAQASRVISAARARSRGAPPPPWSAAHPGAQILRSGEAG